ncbi:hypothetical protein [Yoonia sp. BS5-3]|uniref:Uncharacterized protein n=1 Tax=Yoonia phaeophyticola TaxID=3137369 RepID=A0ABZ2V280_9RHOB
MFLRAASLIGCLMAPASVMAQSSLDFDVALASLEVRFQEFVDAHLTRVCPGEVAALDFVYPESYVAKTLWPELSDRLVEQTEAGGKPWMFLAVFTDDLSEVFDPSSINSMSIVALQSTHVVRALEFMEQFGSRSDIDTRMSVSELQKLRSEILTSIELADCLRANETPGLSSYSENMRFDVNEAIDRGEYCIQWGVFVQRYLDIPFETMTVAERVDAGDRAFSAHEAYLIESGIAEECEEDN